MSLSGSVITLVLHDPDARADDAAAADAARVDAARMPEARRDAQREPWRPELHRVPAGGFDLAAEYDAHGSALFAFAINALRDRGSAEDAVQETFLRAWRSRERFDPRRASARTWLFAIERNVIVDLQRSAGRISRHTTSAPVDDLPALTPDALEHLRLIEAVAKLTPEQRDVIVAVHLTGQSYAELSGATGVPVATLRTRAFYALRALRLHLDARGDSDA